MSCFFDRCWQPFLRALNGWIEATDRLKKRYRRPAPFLIVLKDPCNGRLRLGLRYRIISQKLKRNEKLTSREMLDFTRKYGKVD